MSTSSVPTSPSSAGRRWTVLTPPEPATSPRPLAAGVVASVERVVPVPDRSAALTPHPAGTRTRSLQVCWPVWVDDAWPGPRRGAGTGDLVRLAHRVVAEPHLLSPPCRLLMQRLEERPARPCRSAGQVHQRLPLGVPVHALGGDDPAQQRRRSRGTLQRLAAT